MNEFLRQLKYWWNTKTSGLEDLVEDVRDLHIKELFSTPTNYKPLYKERILLPIFEKDQRGLEICSFETASRVLAVYFGEDISQRVLVTLAWWSGLCNKNGSAQLRSWCKVAQKYGSVFEKDFPSNDSLPWNDYIDVDLEKLVTLASKNKIGSYWRVDTVDEYLACIDRGYAVATGQDWRSVYNQGGGFSAPWIITKAMGLLGFSVGGHATCGIGYTFLKDTKGLVIKKNSYSDQWGDKGFFYEEFDALQKDIDRYGAYAITPIPYTPKDIKVKGLLDTYKTLYKNLMGIQTASELLYETARRLIGQNLAKGNEKLGCAESLSYIIRKAFQENVRYLSTNDFYAYLCKSDKWEKVDEPEPKVIIITPTNTIYPPLTNGHVGIIGQYKAPDGSYYIMSNNSEKGYWDTHFTLKSWQDYYVGKGRGKTSYFRRINK